MKKIIQSRLAKLPPKVAQPLTHLAKIGQMREEDINTVLDAGDLTGNYHTLVGFAAGAMGMKAQRVPVADTVAMAKKLGRQIRLDWSPRRWREEHDRMAKAVTLRQFSEENVDYDVEFFASKLPPKYPGYIIRNSRRPSNSRLVSATLRRQLSSQVRRRLQRVCLRFRRPHSLDS